MLIKAGSVLIVPRNSEKQGDVGSHVADNGQLSLAPEIVTRRTVIKAGKRDTVASIAARYRLSAGQVADWNNVGASAVFKAGQQVVLHLPVRAAARTTTLRAQARPSTRAPVRASAAGTRKAVVVPQRKRR
jgi:membrane-bound lytic murein transglycosylase D